MALSDMLGSDDSLLGSIIFAESSSGGVYESDFSDSVTFSETLSVETVLELVFSDTLSLTELLGLQFSGDFSDSLSLTDDIVSAAAYPVDFDDTLSLSDTMSAAAVFSRLTADMMPLASTLSVVLTSGVEISDTLTLSETIIGAASIPLVPDVISFSETMTGLVSKLFSDTLTLTDSLTFNRTVGKTFSDTLSLTDTVSRTITVTKALDDSLSLVEDLQRVYARTAEFEDTLVFTEEIYREQYYELVPDTLDLSDSFDGQKIGLGILSDSLVFTNSTSVIGSFVRPLDDEIILIDGFIVRIKKGSGQPPDTVINPVVPPPGSYTPPSINEGVIGIRRLVLIEGFNRSIVLPPPEFNDFESFDNQLSVQRSMSGQYKTYKKSSDRIRNNWHWILPKPKADELRAFIDAEDSTLLTITDWRGYIWKAYLLTDSIDFAEIRRWQPCGNAVDVTLEFIGTRYA